MEIKFFENSKRKCCIAQVFVPSHSRTIFYIMTPYYVRFPDLVFEIDFIIEDGFYFNINFCDLLIKSKEGYGINLPNVDWEGTVCTGLDNSIKDKNAIELCKKILDSFWMSEFNQFLGLDNSEEEEDAEDKFFEDIEKGEISLSEDKINSTFLGEEISAFDLQRKA